MTDSSQDTLRNLQKQENMLVQSISFHHRRAVQADTEIRAHESKISFLKTTAEQARNMTFEREEELKEVRSKIATLKGKNNP